MYLVYFGWLVRLIQLLLGKNRVGAVVGRTAGYLVLGVTVAFFVAVMSIPGILLAMALSTLTGMAMTAAWVCSWGLCSVGIVFIVWQNWLRSHNMPVEVADFRQRSA